MTIEEYAEKIAASWPSLTASQLERISALLTEPVAVSDLAGRRAS